MNERVRGRPGNQELIKGINSGRIVSTLKKYGPMTKKEISDITRLSIPSITSNIERLLRSGVISVVGSRTGGMGRRPAVIRFNEFHKYIIGIDLGSRNCKIGLGNLYCEPVAYQSHIIRDSAGGEQVMEDVIRRVKDMLQVNGLSAGDIGAVVIGNPGVIYDDSGRMKMAAKIAERWSDLPVKHIFEKALGSEVLVANDINLSALGENLKGAGKSCSNFMYIRLDAGLGAGIILNGGLYTGAHGAAGEIGFVSMRHDSPEIKTGAYENIENIASISAMIARAGSMLKDNPESLLYELTLGDPSRVDFELILEAIEKDGFLKAEAARMGEYLGYAAANAALILDVELLILGGDVLKLGGYFMDAFRQTLQSLSPIPPRIMPSTLGSNSGIFGAFAMGAGHIFEKNMWNG